MPDIRSSERRPRPDIRLVPFADEHEGPFVAMLADPDVTRFTPLPWPVPPGFAKTWRQRYDAHRPARENFAIEDCADGRFLGIAVAPEVDREARTAELGYAVVPEVRGRGVAVEALAQLTAWALGLGMRRIFLLISVDNTASKVVARRAGYRFEGVLRQTYSRPGVWEDTESWSYVASDPPRQEPGGDDR
jgi:RimJ/RimL family protein N-acetyltransferase